MQIPLLKAHNITAVLNLCDEYRGPQLAYAKNGITQLCLPTIDHIFINLFCFFIYFLLFKYRL